MRGTRGILILVVLAALPGSPALAQTTSTSGTQTSTTTTTQPSAFDSLSPGGQKIALALCGAQAGGCPTGQSTSPTTSATTPTTTSSPKTLTLNQIAQMKQHRGWGEIFKDMQKSGQIPSDVKNLGQLVSGRYQAQSRGTTITTASGRTEVVSPSGSSGSHGQSGGQFGKGRGGDDGAGSSGAGSGSSASAHSSSSSHGVGHGK